VCCDIFDDLTPVMGGAPADDKGDTVSGSTLLA